MGPFLYKMKKVTHTIFANFVVFFEALFLAVDNSELVSCNMLISCITMFKKDGQNES